MNNMNTPLRVLLADDEPHIRAMIAALLRQMGLQVSGEAANGAIALALFRQNPPDLLLLDVNMPVMTGIDTLRELIAEFPLARVIMLTSMADLHTVEECLHLGAFNFIRKDCPLPEIQAAIQEALT